jgi:hypothetical protein
MSKKRKSKIDNPEKQATVSTQDTIHKQTLLTWVRLQTTEGKDESNIVFIRKSYKHGTQNVKACDRTKGWTSLYANTQKSQ